MSTYTDFEARLLLACSILSEDTGQEIVRVGDAVTRFNLRPKPNWIMRALQGYEEAGFSKKMMTFDDPMDQDVWLTAAGAREAERLVNAGLVLEDTASVQPESRVDSSSWTGLPEGFVLGEERRLKLVRELDRLEEVLPTSGLSQSAQAQARAYVIAARALAEAPEPQSDLIWEIIGRANSVAGIASLFVSLAALFSS